MADGTRMQQRRATEADWNTSEYVLQPGELGITTDTSIIKIGNGTSPWNELPIAFESEYLPLLGTAANSELLDGVSADFFVKFADTSVAPEADSYVQRTNDGRVKGADATESDDLVTLDQQDTAIENAVALARRETIIRTVTTGTTAALTDIASTIAVNHSSLTTQVTVTIPTNATTAFPVGSWFDVCAIGEGPAKVIPVSGTVTIRGKVNVFPGYGMIRMTKIGTNEWLGTELSPGKRLPKIRLVRTGSTAYGAGGSYLNVPWDKVDDAATPDVYNPDSEWFSIPGSGISTARRVVINKDGEYLIVFNFISSIGTLTGSRIVKMTADNVAGAVIASQPTTGYCNITARVRLSAGESVGAAHSSSSGGDAADGTGGHRHDYTITRLSD